MTSLFLFLPEVSYLEEKAQEETAGVVWAAQKPTSGAVLRKGRSQPHRRMCRVLQDLRNTEQELVIFSQRELSCRFERKLSLTELL